MQGSSAAPLNANATEGRLALRPKVLPAIPVIVVAGLVGGLMLWAGEKIGWFFVIVTALACVGTVSELSPRNWLWLSAEGFRYGTFWVVSQYRWSDIAGFSIHQVRRAKHRRLCVGYSFSASYRGWASGHLRVFGIFRYRAGFPYDRLLPHDYGMSATQLAELLERWRVRYAAP